MVCLNIWVSCYVKRFCVWCIKLQMSWPICKWLFCIRYPIFYDLKILKLQLWLTFPEQARTMNLLNYNSDLLHLYLHFVAISFWIWSSDIYDTVIAFLSGASDQLVAQVFLLVCAPADSLKSSFFVVTVLGLVAFLYMMHFALAWLWTLNLVAIFPLTK